MSRSWAHLPLALVLLACCGDATSTPPIDPLADGDGDIVSDGGEAEVVDPTGWRDEVVVIDLVSVASESGSLADGDTLDMSWSHQPETYCFNVIEAQAYFSGPVVLFALAYPMPKLSTLTVTVVPESAVDVNLFAYQQGPTDYHLPPDLQSLVGCEASFDAALATNPGVAESLTLSALNDAYNVVIGVAGAAEVVTGAFTLELTLEGGIPQP